MRAALPRALHARIAITYDLCNNDEHRDHRKHECVHFSLGFQYTFFNRGSMYLDAARGISIFDTPDNEILKILKPYLRF